MQSSLALWALGALLCILCATQLVSGASFQQIRVPSNVGAFSSRSRGILSKAYWTNNYNYILSYGATALDSKEHFSLFKVNFGTLFRRLANTTFQLEQPGFDISAKATLPIPSVAALDTYASARTRGAVALTYYNTSRLINSTLGTSDQPYLTLFGGNSNGNLSDLTLQLYFTLTSTADGSGGFKYSSAPSFGAFSAGGGPQFAREGHTGGVSRANLPADVYGRLFYFGGKNGTTWFNTMFYQDTGVNALTTITPTNAAPSPRAYHAMVVLDTTVLAGRYLFVWGGETADGVYASDGPFLYDIVTNSWATHTPTNAGPAARMGHAMLTLSDPDFVYLYGGMSGTNQNPVFYDDLWSYQVSTQTWTQLQTGQGGPVIGGAERRPAGRAFAQVAAFDATQFIIFGGENSQGPQNDFWSVNVNLTCPYYCWHPVDEGFQGACMDYQQCHFIKDCAWDANYAFQCFLDCVDAPSQCNARLNAFTCPNGLQKCWSGFCQEKLENCKPYPACEPGERRCGDNGDCVPESTSCNPVTCSGTDKLCADGKCRPSCFPSYGCLPDEKPIQCDDGSCAATYSDCNKGCTNSSLPKKCWQGCVAATESCEQPYWTDDIHLLAFTTPQQQYYRLYRKDGAIQDPEDLRGIIHLDGVQPGFNMTIYMKSSYGSELREIGPHPTWSKEFDPSYMRSIFVKTNVTNVVQAYRAGSGGINIIFRMKLNANETAYWAYHPGHGLGYIAATNCVAMAIDWFWDDMDLAPDSPLANVSYIKAYREKMLALSKNATYTGPEPNPPPKRWQCQLLEPGNAWPRFTNVTDDILVPTADRYVGIRLTEDFFERTMGIIYAPFPLPTPPAAAPVAKLPPADPTVTYIVLAIAAALLLALIIVVLVKTFAQRN